jgi:hypothetical protein
MVEMKRAMAPRLYYGNCKRCGREIASSSWSITHPLGQICSQCTTQEEKQEILDYQAGVIIKKIKNNPHEQFDVHSDVNTGGEEPPKLYTAFHGDNPKGLRKVELPKPVGRLILVGKLVELTYQPAENSKLAKNQFVHAFGDTGDAKLPSNSMLATDESGKNFFIVRSTTTIKRPFFSERGIIG